ncbi:NAD(P)-dependent oxidoreductase [Sphingomonas sp. MMS24-J13]|uniref:NAD(P)-dependent oxidoreductase n=1 Tax=Sphingomonas sp. MMS24-J13 TaxID=3238686 RepID=UPI00385013C6
MKIGFVGLGRMGTAIAGNLLKAGHEVSVWNRSADKAEPLVAAGATLATSPAEAAAGGIVMSMLADDHAVEAVVFGEGGILSARSQPIHVSLSTIGLRFAERLSGAHAEAGGALVSAPVFGRPAAAEAAQLFIAAAGAPDALARCQPLFDAIGQKTFILGDSAPMANLMKLCGNFLIGSVIEGMAEAMTLGQRGGIPKAKMLEVLTGSLFDAPIYRVYGDIIARDAYSPAGFTAPLGLKDMNLVSEAANDMRVPMPVLAVVRNHVLSLIAREGEEVDWSALARMVEGEAGI